MPAPQKHESFTCRLFQHNRKESGQAAFGNAGGDSRHWAAAGFPKKDGEAGKLPQAR